MALMQVIMLLREKSHMTMLRDGEKKAGRASPQCQIRDLLSIRAGSFFRCVCTYLHAGSCSDGAPFFSWVRGLTPDANRGVFSLSENTQQRSASDEEEKGSWGRVATVGCGRTCCYVSCNT